MVDNRERELFTKAQNGDREAVTRFQLDHQGPMRSYFARLSSDAVTAERPRTTRARGTAWRR